MSCSFRASWVRGHRKDFQIKHCRPSLTFRVLSKVFFGFILAFPPFFFPFFIPPFRQENKRQERRDGGLEESLARGDVKGRSSSPTDWNITARPGRVIVSDAPSEFVTSQGKYWGKEGERRRRGTRSMKCFWLNHRLWVNPLFNAVLPL